jgi:hypothetical protein
MRSITLKMMLAFLSIALVSIALIVFLARWNTGMEFSRFVIDRRGAELVESLGIYYQENGSWAGVEGAHLPTTARRNRRMDRPGSFFSLADQSGKIVLAGPGYHLGSRFPRPILVAACLFK